MIGCTQETRPFVLDLTGGTPLFPAHESRNGSLRVDPHRRRPSATPATRTARHWRCLPALGSSSPAIRHGAAAADPYAPPHHSVFNSHSRQSTLLNTRH